MAVNTSTGFATALLGGASFASIFNNGVIEIRSGPQPANADAAATGTLLAYITRDGGVFTPGSPTNGLQFEHNGRMIFSNPLHQWVITGVGTGVAGWFRLRGNAPDDGAFSLALPRIDGAVGLYGAPGDIQLQMTTTSIVPSTTIHMTQWFYGMPPLGD